MPDRRQRRRQDHHLNAIAGVLPIASGDILYDGARIDSVPAHRRLAPASPWCPRGAASSPASRWKRTCAWARDSRSDRAAHRGRPRAHLHHAAAHRGPPAGRSPVRSRGASSRWSRSAAPLLSRPRLLLLDEPSMGLAPRVVEDIFTLIGKIAREGVALLLVEQNARPGAGAGRSRVCDGERAHRARRRRRRSAAGSQSARSLPGRTRGRIIRGLRRSCTGPGSTLVSVGAPQGAKAAPRKTTSPPRP